MDDILKVTGLNKSYDNFSLKDVSFTLPEGCITGFIGVNGAGKTTTLRSILGLTSRISGHINFFGMDIEKDARKIKDRIGVVLDDGCFYDELSLAEMKDVIEAAHALREQGIAHVVISLGAEGALWVNASGEWIAKPPSVDVVSTVGAGDSMVGGLIYGLLMRESSEHTLRLATAVAALAVSQSNVGITDRPQLAAMMARVDLQPFN